MPINVSSTTPMAVGGPEVVPTGSIATPQMEPTALTLQGLPQPLASSRKTIYPNGNWRNTREILYNGTSDSASLKVPLTQLH